MPTSYTSLLGLALPATGELSGTWGDTVNNYITQYLDAAISGTQTLSTDADVTLTKTTGTNLTSGSSQYMILNCTGARSAARNITVPAASKTYVVINATSGGFAVTLRGAGPTTGISIAAGEYAVCAWNGSDFIKVSSLGGSGTFSSLTLTGGSANTVPYLDGSKAFTSSANLTFDGNSFLIGNPSPFVSVTQPGVFGVGGFGVYTYRLGDGNTAPGDISCLAQNSVTFFGDNGATTSPIKRFISLYASPKISNSGAGGGGSVQAVGVWSVPELESSGVTANVNIVSVQGHGIRYTAADLSSNSLCTARGGLFTGRHLPPLPATALSGVVFGVKGHGINKSGTTTELIGVSSAIWLGNSSGDSVTTATNATIYQGEDFQVGSSGANAATLTNGYGVNIGGPIVAATGTLTNWYAYYAGTPTVTGTLTNRWGVYIADSLSNNYFAGNVQIGNPSPFVSVTQPGVVSVGGYGTFTYIGPGGGVVTTDTIMGLMQNASAFSGDNGLTAQRMVGLFSAPKFSNSGSGGSAELQVSGFFGVPFLESSGVGARVNLIGIHGHGTRTEAADLSTNASNTVRGGRFTGNHAPTAPSSIVSGTVFGVIGEANNNSGTISTFSGVVATLGIGNNASAQTTTTTEASVFRNASTTIGLASGVTATVTNGYGVNIAGPSIAATGTLTNWYAFYAGTPTVTGTLTNRWGMYISDSLSPNYFAGNVLVGGTSAPGQGVVYMADAAVVPASNPTGGGVLYVEAGALKYRGSSGTITTIANA